MTLLLLVNLALLVFAFLCFRKNLPDDEQRTVFKHLGMLEAAWAGFQFMFCLFLFFDIMEAEQEGKSWLVAGRKKATLLFVLCGFGIIHVSIFVTIVVRVFKKRIA